MSSQGRPGSSRSRARAWPGAHSAAPPPGSPKRLCVPTKVRAARSGRQTWWGLRLHPYETALREKRCFLNPSPPSFTFNERKRKGGRRQLGLGQRREQGPLRCKLPARSPLPPASLGVSADESQLGLERTLTFHRRHHPPSIVRHEKLFEVSRIQACLRSGTKLRIRPSQPPVAGKSFCPLIL